MSYEHIIYDKRRDEHLAVVTINRPEVLNAVNVAATDELTEIWVDFGSDPELWVAMSQSYTAIERVRRSEDSKGGRRAFAEKRAPRWQGR